VKGRFVPEGSDDVTGLRQSAECAAADWVDAIIVRSGHLGDPIVLAAGLVDSVPRGLLGAALSVGGEGRHPSVLARDMSALDHVCAGRALLCLTPPFDDGTDEAIAILRAMWRDGIAKSGGPRYPTPGAVNRPRPPGRDSPLLALDLTDADDDAASQPWATLVDLLVFRTGDPADGECRLERTQPA
jgi:alkanesulfonate monooxygenase SsuD/methylene tetrahydromethanopterin reductase-like flavin-dependent oxidoreductase (luciferase family)